MTWEPRLRGLNVVTKVTQVKLGVKHKVVPERPPGPRTVQDSDASLPLSAGGRLPPSGVRADAGG